MRREFVFLTCLSIFLVLSCGQKDPLGVPLGFLFVDSDPDGALIFLDGDTTDLVTPDTLTEVTTGAHTVSVLLIGYESDPAERIIEVKLGEVASAYFTLTLASAARVVLLEEFTNTSCIPCAQASPLLDAIAAYRGRSEVVAVKYHAGFPAPTDPFYLANMQDNQARVGYYSVTGIPHLRVDGTTVSPSLDSTRIESDIDARLGLPSPIQLSADYEVSGSQYSVTARIIGFEDTGYEDLMIRFALVESDIDIDPPPGANGETDFEHTMRKMLPDATGEHFHVQPSDTLEFKRQFTVDPSWNVDQLETVVFVQSESGLEVIGACSDHKGD
jgi:hypothetical protein